jgi:predicted metal-dependent HD superfamily phosphohydrolase
MVERERYGPGVRAGATMNTIDQWWASWQSLGVAPDERGARLHAELLDRYAEPQRHYHTRQHLTECFAQWARLRELSERPGEVEIALWFHDAIYEVRAHDNELRSAQWAEAAALAAGVAPAVAGRLHALVMATCHAAAPAGIDAELLVDVDLSILGAPTARFWEYERQIRREYAWVPELEYVSGRARVLEGFLARPRIYASARCHDELEAAARANLAASIARLRGEPGG